MAVPIEAEAEINFRRFIVRGCEGRFELIVVDSRRE